MCVCVCAAEAGVLFEFAVTCPKPYPPKPKHLSWPPCSPPGCCCCCMMLPVTCSCCCHTHSLVPLSNILTPNQFEAELLTGLPVTSEAQALAAAEALHKAGPHTVVSCGCVCVCCGVWAVWCVGCMVWRGRGVGHKRKEHPWHSTYRLIAYTVIHVVLQRCE